VLLSTRGTSGLRALLSLLSTVARQLCRGICAVALSALAAVPDLAFAQAVVMPAESARETPAASGLSKWDAPEPWRTDRFFLETSLYTRHFDYDPAHDNHQDLLLGEWNVTERWLLGAAFFDNSFGQRSQYVYGGYRFRPFDQLQPLYIKISAGLVHGYKDPYQHKIPLNDAGIAPAIVPSVGYCFHRFCSELVIFGNAGVLLTFGVTIP
jgi:hypothetical protein